MTAANVRPKEGDIFTVMRELEVTSQPAAGGTKSSAAETLPDPVRLRESLLVKRDIFRKLEKEGYVDNSDISKKVNNALKILDEIIKSTS